MKKKKLVILSSDTGFGHRTAARAVRLAVEERYGNELVVEVINLLNNPKTPKILRDSQTDYDKVLQRAPELYQIGYEASDTSITTALGEQALAAMLYRAVSYVIKEHQPDAILCTFPLYTAALLRYFENKGFRIPILVVITDLVSVHQIWYNRQTDYLLVPTDTVERQARAVGVSPEKIHLTGIPVSPQMAQMPEDRALLRRSLGWQEDMTTLLAVGSKRVKHLTPILNVINHFGAALQLVVICGGNQELYEQMQKVDWHIPVRLYSFVENTAPMLQAADAILCKAGGLITTEALACGLPMMIVEAIPGQEEGNASYVVENEAGVFVQEPIAALETLHHWLAEDGKELQRLRENARRLGHPQAAYQVADLCWGAASKGRQMNKSLGRQLKEHILGDSFQQGEEKMQEINLNLWDHAQFQAFLDGLANSLLSQLQSRSRSSDKETSRKRK